MINKLQLNTQLYPADVVVAKKKKGFGRILNHYIVYAGDGIFIGNLKGGVKILTNSEISELLVDYEPSKIKPFVGSLSMRNQAINRAYSRVGQKYNLLNFNCKHFANLVQKGTESSFQVTVTFSFLALGLVYKLTTINNGKRR